MVMYLQYGRRLSVGKVFILDRIFYYGLCIYNMVDGYRWEKYS
jgi:hypothetical protein